MNKTRLEAFSDAVIAIIITIMVLEMKVPHGTDFATLKPLLPVFLSYVLSFVYLGIYWNNHHHMLHVTHHVSGRILWANLHLLFWLSLIPFVSGWMGENRFAPVPTALYGVILLLAAFAYLLGRVAHADQHVRAEFPVDPVDRPAAQHRDPVTHTVAAFAGSSASATMRLRMRRAARPPVSMLIDSSW